MVERQDPDQLSLLSNAGNMRMVVYRMSLKQIWIYIYFFNKCQLLHKTYSNEILYMQSMTVHYIYI